MGLISSSVGLITGTKIQDTVDALINLSGQPRDQLKARNDLLIKERSAVTDITVLAVGVQLAVKSFGTASSLRTTSVASSNATALSVVRAGNPETGSYSVRTLQTAGTQGFRTKTLGSAGKAFGSAGTLVVRGGGTVDRSVSLDQLNGGRGVAAGSIRITDRSGASAIVDLSAASTVDEVLKAINDASGIEVSATTDGDAIRLVDKSGESISNLRVEDVGGGQTAADLGLRGIDTSSSAATGADIYQLSEGTKLNTLRDGRGLSFTTGADLQVSLRDGTKFNVDFDDFSKKETKATGQTSTATANAQLTFTTKEVGSDFDGLKVRFIQDDTVIQGTESASLIDGPAGKELVVKIKEGVSTAADIASAVSRNSEANSKLVAAFEGDGSGLVSLSESAVLSGGSEIEGTDNPDLGDLLRILNVANPSKFKAELSPGRDSIRIVDLTSGTEDFSVEDVGSSTVAAELGLTGTAVDGEISGARLLSGLSTVSLGALAGGSGLGTLGSINILIGDGSNADIDLSGASSLQDVINSINESGLEVEATISSSGTGIQVRDFSGGTSEALTISSLDDTAAKLGLDRSTTDVVLQGDDLQLQFVSRASRLSDLLQGKGVGDGAFRITDSKGKIGAINLKTDSLGTVGELIDAIDALDLDIKVSINETGDGIRIVDTGGGAGSLKVEDIGNSKSAQKLGLAGTSIDEVVDGELVSTLNGRQADVFQISSTDTLSSLSTKIRDTGRFVTASVVGNATVGANLSITSLRGGDAGRFTVQNTGFDLGVRESSRGRDAVIAVGDTLGGTASIFRSADGVFSNAIAGVSLTAKTVTDEAVKIDVTEDTSGLEGSIKRFVDQYNKLQSRVKELTFYNPDTTEVGLLFGKAEVVRIQSSLGRVLTGRYHTGGSVQGTSTIGLSVNQDGVLAFDASKLKSALADNPESVESFLTDKEFGFVAKVDKAIESIAGVNNGLLISRTTTINNQIDKNSARVNAMNKRLEVERTRLLKQFNDMESSIAKLQSNQKYLSTIQSFSSFTTN